MSGFLYYGFGVADKFKRVRDIAILNCPICKKTQMFQMVEVKSKVHVVYIPTVPLKDKGYGVACEKCKNGYFINYAAAQSLINTTTIPESFVKELKDMIDSSGDKAGPSFIRNTNDAQEQKQMLAPKQPQMQPQYQTQPQMQAPAFCSRCGTAVGDATDLFCCNCGARLM